MEKPIKGKDVIAYSDNGDKHYVFRCACTNENCEDWRCSISGSRMMINVKKWEYNK